MIKSRLYTDKGAYKLTIRGHSGTAPQGEDLICACTTMAAYQLAQLAREMYDRGLLQEDPKILIREGKAKLVIRPTADGSAEAAHTLYVVCTSLRLLAHNYPKAIVFSDDTDAHKGI